MKSQHIVIKLIYRLKKIIQKDVMMFLLRIKHVLELFLLEIPVLHKMQIVFKTMNKLHKEKLFVESLKPKQPFLLSLKINRDCYLF